MSEYYASRNSGVTRGKQRQISNIISAGHCGGEVHRAQLDKRTVDRAFRAAPEDLAKYRSATAKVSTTAAGR